MRTVTGNTANTCKKAVELRNSSHACMWPCDWLYAPLPPPKWPLSIRLPTLTSFNFVRFTAPLNSESPFCHHLRFFCAIENNKSKQDHTELIRAGDYREDPFFWFEHNPLEPLKAIDRPICWIRFRSRLSVVACLTADHSQQVTILFRGMLKGRSVVSYSRA